ncbi:glycosyl transferase [Tenuifilaceae bacterium CYCD]|nr:glycosyl transferase [Tenuifilaceae bacterium CYCD]
MKILLINNHHHLDGGAHRVYFNTGQLLEKHGHQVAYYSTRDENSEPTQYLDYFLPRRNFKTKSLITKLINSTVYIYNRQAYKSIIRLINDFKPDVAHIHLFYGGLTVSVLKALRDKNIPIVHTVHDYRLICPVNTLLDSKGQICELCVDRKYYHCVQKRCSKGNLFNSIMLMCEAYWWRFFNKPIELIDRFIFVSKFIRDKHIEFNSRFNEKQIQLYNFHDIKHEGKTSRMGDYLFFYGRLSPEKGLELLLELISQTGIKLKIAGGGPLEDLTLKYSTDFENIEFLGFKNGEELFDLIRECRYVVVPSEWYENNPMTIVEAFSLGKPVIGANIGGIPELVINGKTGFLFQSKSKEDLNEKILTALNVSEKEYNELSENALNFAHNNFNSMNSYQELMKIYNQVIEENEKNH